MNKILLLLAALVVLSAGTMWLSAGANHGWTKTLVPHKTTDPVTGIESDSWEKKFVPGVDFLGAAGAVAVILVSASFLFRNKKQPKTKN